MGVLIFYCCTANYHKLSGLKQHPFTSSLFCRSEVWALVAGFSAQSHKLKPRVDCIALSPVLQGPNSTYVVVGEFSSLWL